jgi:hypothetical protein
MSNPFFYFPYKILPDFLQGLLENSTQMLTTWKRPRRFLQGLLLKKTRTIFLQGLLLKKTRTIFSRDYSRIVFRCWQPEKDQDDFLQGLLDNSIQILAT